MKRILLVGLILSALVGGGVLPAPASADVCERNPSLCR